jgi:hypothetical protein
MLPPTDECAHPGWRSDFAPNGKMHEFCVACGAERRVTAVPESSDAARLRNGLRWIRHMAATHYLGGSVDPQQMRALAALAEKVLAGDELSDYDRAVTAARGKAQEWARSAGVDLVTEEDLAAPDSQARIAAKLAGGTPSEEMTSISVEDG